MMTMSETKTNDTMKKTKNTMNDASKCVSLAPRLSRAKSHAYARHQESRKRLNKQIPSNTLMPTKHLTPDMSPHLAGPRHSSCYHECAYHTPHCSPRLQMHAPHFTGARCYWTWCINRGSVVSHQRLRIRSRPCARPTKRAPSFGAHSARIAALASV